MESNDNHNTHQIHSISPPFTICADFKEKILPVTSPKRLRPGNPARELSALGMEPRKDPSAPSLQVESTATGMNREQNSLPCPLSPLLPLYPPHVEWTCLFLKSHVNKNLEAEKMHIK